MNAIRENNSKEKKRKTHVQINIQKENKDEHSHHHHHHHHDKSKNSFSKSNYDLQHLTLQKKLNAQSSMEQTEDDKTKIDPSIIIKTRGILKPSRYRNKDKDSLDLYHHKTDINENNDKNSPEIFRTIGKKAPNFSNNFEIKSNSLMELIKRFKAKALEIHCKLNLISNSNDKSSNEIMKNKNNIMKLINFNEVVIFERKIIGFIERQVLKYMKIVNKIESLILNDEINLELLNKFYNDIGKESTIENDRNNISTLESKDNLINSPINNEYFGTDKDKSEKKLFHQRLFLPSLKNLKTSLEKYESFRNSNMKQGTTSVKQTHKQFDLFKPKKGDNSLKKIRTITETPALKLKLTENNNDNNLVINEDKHEDASVKKDKDNEGQNNDNNNDNMKNSKNDTNKEKASNEVEEQNKDFQRPTRPRRLSVAQLTMPNYKDINNVNDYILNYKSNNKNKGKKEKEKDKNENINDEIDKSKDKLDVNKNKKKKLNLKLTKDILDDFKIKFKELNNKSNKNKGIETEGSNNLDNSESSNKEKTNNLKNKKELNNLNTSIISNVGTKDPLDDIRYLHKIRKGHEKSLYRESSIIVEEKSEKKEEEVEEEEEEEEEEEKEEDM